MERDLTDNELIAQFYGAEFIRKEDQFRPGKFIEQWIIKGNPFNQYRDQETKYWYSKELLLYDESWSWLMPVVEKIEGLGHKIIISNTHGQYCNIMYDVNLAETSDTKAMGVGETKIEAVYKAVVEFIQWYNQNRKQ